MAKAACKGIDGELMYPKRGDPGTLAKAVCSGCFVQDECLEYALVNGEAFGVWGGKSERQRRLIRISRRNAKVVAM